jgi:hypothetical protein
VHGEAWPCDLADYLVELVTEHHDLDFIGILGAKAKTMSSKSRRRVHMNNDRITR